MRHFYKIVLLILLFGSSVGFSVAQQRAKTLAHWKFDPAHKKSGSIGDGNLVLKDLSGNGNDLAFKVLENRAGNYGVPLDPATLTPQQKQALENAFEWKTGNYGKGNRGKNLLFKKGGRKDFWRLSGYFQTVKTASLNTETFTNGYTIELLFKMPSNFSAAKHRWIALLNRHGSAKQMAQKTGKHYIGGDAGSTLANLNISNLRELQWTQYSTKPLIGKTYHDNETSWSFSLDDDDAWYHVVMINDTKQTKIYVNGVTDFRNADASRYPADGGIQKTLAPEFGWDIGGKGDTYPDGSDPDSYLDYHIKKIFEGQMQEVRFTKGALPKSDWLYAQDAKTARTKIGTNKNIPLLTHEDNYNIVFVPDTQKPIRYKPEIVEEQMKWIANNSDATNIVFTNFLGDLVDRWQEKYEWHNFLNAVEHLNRKRIRFMTIDGNHDGFGLEAGSSTHKMYPDYVGKQYYSGKDYYFNNSPSGYAAYSIVRGGNYTYLFISSSYYQNPHIKDLAWINSIIRKYDYLPVIYSTHQHLNFKEDGSGVYRVSDKVYQKYRRYGWPKQFIWRHFSHFSWERIISNNNNVFMSMCGHHHGSGYHIQPNEQGNKVLEGVFDYQSAYNGGNGWMNFAEFDEKNNRINFRVFSPWVASIPDQKKTFYDVKHLTRPQEMFTYNIDFKKRFDFYPELQLANEEVMVEENVQINYTLKAPIANSYIGIFKKGVEPKRGSEFLKKNISGRQGTVSFSSEEDGAYYAVLMKNDLYVPISNQVNFDIKATAWDGQKWTPSRPDDTKSVKVFGDLTLSTDLNVRKLSIVPPAKVVVPAGKTLSVKETIRGEGLTIDHGGSLLLTACDGVKSPINFVRKGNAVYYSYLSTPVRRAKYSSISQKTTLWYEPASSWIPAPLGATITPGSGFLTRAPDWVSLKGIPNTCDVQVSLTATENRPYKGYNLVGNPYPAAIGLGKFLMRNTQIRHTLWLWDSGIDNYRVKNMATASENYPIPSMQGFLVKTDHRQAKLHFNHDMRLAGNNGNFYRKSAKNMSRVRLIGGNDTNKSELVVVLSEDFTPNFDPMYDAETFAHRSAFTLSALHNDTEQSVLALPHAPEGLDIPLSIRSQKPTFTLKLAEQLNLPKGYALCLKDRLHHKSYPITEGQTLSLSAASAQNGRYRLCLKNKNQLDAEGASAAIQVWGENNRLNVWFNDKTIKKAKVSILTLTGKEVYAAEYRQTAGEQLLSVPHDLPPQVYLVRVRTENTTYTDRFVSL